MSECNTAARDLGLDDQSAEEITEGANRPYSCYFKYTSSEGNRLYFNTAGDKSYVSTERRSLCKLVQTTTRTTVTTTTRTTLTTTTATPCDGELNTYKSGIKTCNSDGCSIAYTFAALPAPATVVSAHLSVRQAGDLDSSSEYAVLKAGGSTMADCKQSTTNWQSPAACQGVDVKSKISSQVANNGPSSNGYTYRSKGAYYCSGSRSEFSGTFSTLASCQAACSAKLECHTLNFYSNSDACYWCPSSGWSSYDTGSANGQMWEKGDAITTSTAATTTVAGADTPTYSLAVELDSTSSVDADDDDSNGPTNTMLGADFTLVVCEDPRSTTTTTTSTTTTTTPTFSCKDDTYFMCTSKDQCVRTKLVCDGGNPDCDDGSDEQDCTTTITSTTTSASTSTSTSTATAIKSATGPTPVFKSTATPLVTTATVAAATTTGSFHGGLRAGQRRLC